MFCKSKMKPAKIIKEYKGKSDLYKHTTTVEFRDGTTAKVVSTDVKVESRRTISTMPSYSDYRLQDKYRYEYQSVEVTEIVVHQKNVNYLSNSISTITGDNKSITFMIHDVKMVTTDKEKIGEVDTVTYQAV